jgi:hypothetical protein
MPNEAPPSGGTADESGVQAPAGSILREAVEASDRLLGKVLPTPRLGKGEILSERFVIESLAGCGGMGTVYRALDRVSGTSVAIKVMARCREHDARFAQEARVLSELTHPAIVRYVAHGATSQREPFLAMEWLEGEDLARRLTRTGLSVAETLSVARRVAEGLSVSHARGILHRDVKPSNVFLVDGDPSRAKLLDFGIVRLQPTALAPNTRPVTGPGTVLGTVGYMSPEQAIADRSLDARTDVFALGCLLFECLTGQPAFRASHHVAVLVKVLREQAPRLREFRPDLPPQLDELVARMLRKDRGGRPPDGGAILRELEALGNVAGGAPGGAARPLGALSDGEQRVVSILLAVIPDEPQRVGEIVRRHGGEYAWLANGTLLATLSSLGSASEQVLAAAACSLQLWEALPSARIALVTGRAQTTGGGPPGPAVDRAAALLAQSDSPGIRTDETTAGLLAERFELRAEREALLLLSRRSDAEPPRTLLGKPTPCVGRAKELALLEGTLRECIEESVARAVLVTGPAGQGKSRLRHEFVACARARGDVAILTARADPVGAGSAFLLVRQLVRQATGLRDGDSQQEQHAKLRAHVASVCAESDAGRIADFLGELIGAPSTGRPSPQLGAARNDPQIMAVWLLRSFGEWLAAECAARPLLIVLEDLHWGDVPSAMYLGEGLRALASRHLMILALARPEVHEVLPNLWPTKQELRLDRLGPRAAERLVRAALGDAVAADVAASIVERADGNAFYLEELIRRVAEDGSDAFPDTVLALVQSRLERLEPRVRRIVRAASIFGEVFCRGGVAHLLGEDAHAADLDAWLRHLTEREIFAAAADARPLNKREYAFRHGLLREGAYAMLTTADAARGHKLAAEWLEATGESDPLILADHFERGGEPARAVPWLVRAADTAIGACDVAGESALAARGLACGARGADAGLLHFAHALACFARGDMTESIGPARTATELLPVGSTRWFGAAGFLFMVGAILGDPGVSAPMLLQILQAPVPQGASGPYGFAVNLTCTGLATSAQSSLGWSFLERAEAVGGDSDLDPMFAFWLQITRAVLHVCSGEPGLALADLSGVPAKTQETGDEIIRVTASQWITAAYAAVAHCPHAERTADEIRELSALSFNNDFGSLLVAVARLHAGRAPEAIHTLRDLARQHRDPLLGGCARSHLSVGLVQIGDLDAACREALAVLEQVAPLQHAQVAAFAALANVELLRGRPADALAWADRGLSGDARLWHVSTLYLLRAEALHALARTEEARFAIDAARQRISAIADTIHDPDLRESWRTNVVANVRTMARAREWLGEA